MTNYRLLAENEKMNKAFPKFVLFRRGNIIGFAGELQGGSGRVYQVEVRARADKYPAQAPKIYIQPRVGKNWLLDGSLCVYRTWRPDRDTFAQQVLFAAAYLQKNG